MLLYKKSVDKTKIYGILKCFIEQEMGDMVLPLFY